MLRLYQRSASWSIGAVRGFAFRLACGTLVLRSHVTSAERGRIEGGYRELDSRPEITRGRDGPRCVARRPPARAFLFARQRRRETTRT